MQAVWKILLMIGCVLLVHLSIIFLRPGGASSNSPSGEMKLVIDTDAGGDDAVAILLALNAVGKVQVIAITCTYGNTDEANVERNVLKILTVAGRSDIPVYAGAHKPLLENYTAGDYFGKDGLGDFEFGREIIGKVDRSKHASLAMIELAKKHAGDISILTLGPLTNVALAASLDPNFTQNVDRFYVMGSAVNENENNGESTETEFNFSLDPESNAIFFNSKTKNKTLITPWDVVQKCKIPKEWRTEILGKLPSAFITFLNEAESVVLSKLDDWFAADSIAVATALWPDLVTSTLDARMTSVTSEPHPGAVKVDVNSADKNVEIIRDFNVTGFQERLMTYLA